MPSALGMGGVLLDEAVLIKFSSSVEGVESILGIAVASIFE